ncbi:MAG: thiamine pyrophosphate-dependent dehydrogenase E1 component subunit alpha, partial [Catalinimonas sp.]
MTTTAPAFAYDRRDLTDGDLRALYEALLLPRLIEERMLVLLRQGKISKWFAGIGQEGIAVGAVRALAADEWVMPLHRNLGVFTGRGVPLGRLFAQWQGKVTGFTKGRDRSFHFGAPDHHIVGMISHLGPQLAVADGVALAHKLDGEAKVALAFSGDGGTSEGDFHEALNVAAVWDLPVIFVVENNGWGLSTPAGEQFRCAQLADRGVGYGMEAHCIDGNNVLEVYHTIDRLARELRERPRPVLVEAMTFRMRGHEEASGTKYVPAHLFDTWAERDPVLNFERYLRQAGILTEADVAAVRDQHKANIEAGLAEAFAAPAPRADTATETGDVYA